MSAICSCLTEKIKRKEAQSNVVSLVQYTEGYDEDGNPCPVHDPGKKLMSDDHQDKLQEIRKRRGAELRALIVSWQEEKSYEVALREQQAQIAVGKFEPSDEWGTVAEEFLAMYISRPQMPDNWEEPDDGPKLVLP